MNSAANFRRSTDAAEHRGYREILKSAYSRRGFFPAEDPLCRFPHGSPYALLDEIGEALPSLRQAPMQSRLNRQIIDTVDN